MSSETIVLLVVVLLLVGALPAWPYSRAWGYTPMGVLTVLLVIFLLWAVTSNRPLFTNSGQGAKATVQDAAQELKEAGRDVAGDIRRAVQ